MDTKLKEHLENFLKICYKRLEGGETLYHDRYKKLDLYDQIIEELADIANYAVLQYVKIVELKEKSVSN